MPTATTVAKKVKADLSEKARAAADAARAWRHDQVRQPSWAVTSVTGEKARLAAAKRAREASQDGAGEAVAAAAETPSHRADAGAAWGTLVHGLLEHAMRHDGATRADLDRLARWLTVETPDLRPFIPEALDLVEAVRKAPFWQEARAGAEVHVEVPFAVRVAPSRRRAGRPSCTASSTSSIAPATAGASWITRPTRLRRTRVSCRTGMGFSLSNTGRPGNASPATRSVRPGSWRCGR